MLKGEHEAAAALTGRLEQDGICPDHVRRQRCRYGVWNAFSDGDWRNAWAAYRSPDCEGYFGEALIMAYESALLAGLEDEAAALRETMDEALGEQVTDDDRRALDLHLEGIRLRLEGRPGEAAELFREVDRVLAYWRPEQGYFKLANRAQLWQALTAAGAAKEAEQVLAGLRSVNPEIADRWTEHAHSAGTAGRAAAERPSAEAAGGAS